MDELDAGIRRVTLPLPTRPGHVHSYLLPGDDGWTVVDTGLGLPDAKERWASELAELPGPVTQIVVTHFHPDHVGAAADLVELTGAPVAQGRVDYEQCRLVWDGSDWADVLVDWFRRQGVPDEVMRELIEQGALWRPFIRFQPDPRLLDPGDHVGGWRAVAAPGHADGQLMLVRDDVLVAADHVLDPITPTVGLWPRSRPDRWATTRRPRGDGRPGRPCRPARPRRADSRPRCPCAGADRAPRRTPLRDGGRARRQPRTGYEVSFPLFGDDLKPSARRFAVAETLSHLERLVLEGGARRTEDDRRVAYTSAE